MEVHGPRPKTEDVRIRPEILVLGSVVSVQAGQALGKHLFAQTGPAGVVALRLGFAAIILAAVHRPGMPPKRDLVPILGFGTAIAGMNLIYPALRYLQLGVASGLQLLGPLTVALLLSRRIRDLVLAAIAGLGVWLFYSTGSTTLPAPGVALALISAASMGGYLLLSRKVGATTTDGSRLTLAVIWAAVLTVPFGAAESGTALLRPSLLVVGFGLAVLSAVIPYSLEFAALRRIPPRTVGVLQGLEAGVAGLAGAAILAEQLTFAAWSGVACVTAAAVGASRKSL
jgi:inner membrane transporter RhtA